ncbi:MAG: carbon-nitrogen family hydrolase [Syntrophales bacterium]
MRIALVQMDVAYGDIAVNHAKAHVFIAEGLARGAELFVFPELWTTGYKLKEIGNMAETLAGKTMAMLCRAARESNVAIVAGSIPEACDGKIYNTACAIGKDGRIVGRYRKIHLIGLMDEDLYLSPGDEQCIFTLDSAEAGMIICYDLRFPELPRALALQGARILFVPAEWPSVRGNHWRILNIARAIENQVFVIAVNRVGSDPDNTFFGHSLAVDPWGEILVEGSGTKEELLIVDIDPASVENVRKRVPVFQDRRPACY